MADRNAAEGRDPRNQHWIGAGVISSNMILYDSIVYYFIYNMLYSENDWVPIYRSFYQDPAFFRLFMRVSCLLNSRTSASRR